VVAFKTLPAISPWKAEGYKYVQRFAMSLGQDIVVLETQWDDRAIYAAK